MRNPFKELKTKDIQASNGVGTQYDINENIQEIISYLELRVSELENIIDSFMEETCEDCCERRSTLFVGR